MDFGLSEDQVLLKDTIRRFLDEECPTTRVRADHGERRRGHDPALWQRARRARRRRAASCRPSTAALGLELLDLALAAEELGYAATPGPFLGSRDGDGRARRGRRRRRSRRAGCRRIAARRGDRHRRARRGGRRVGRRRGCTTRADGGTLTGAQAARAVRAASPTRSSSPRATTTGPACGSSSAAPRARRSTPLKGIDMTRRVDAVALRRDTPATKLAGGPRGDRPRARRRPRPDRRRRLRRRAPLPRHDRASTRSRASSSAS